MANEIFIGRRQEMDRLWRDVFGIPASEMGPCYSLIGPNNIGKTALISQMARRFKEHAVPNVYYISTTLMGMDSEWMFLIMLVCSLKNEVTEERLRAAPYADDKYISNILDAYAFFDNEENWADTESNKFNIRATQHWNNLFSSYRRIGIRLIVSIDEFDIAKKLCKRGMLFGKLFGLCPKAKESSGHTVILISRRSVSNIEHDMENGSTLASGYPTILLKGFNNEELEEYFASYSAFKCGMPDEDARRQILYYCGRNPGLLMLMRHEAGLLEASRPLIVQELYCKNRLDFEAAYNRMSELMKDERTSSNVDVKCFEIFLEAFIGPVSSEPDVFKAGLEGLENHGFALQSPPGGDIYSLAGLDDFDGADSTVYEPMSPYFVQYVTERFLPNEKENLCNLLVKTEMTLREAIDEIGTFIYTETWDSVIDGFLPREKQSQRQSFYKRLQESSTANNASVRGIRNTLLNVLSFRDYLDLCRQNWGLMNGFFRYFKTNTAIQHAIDCLYEARNLHSHKNFMVLDRPHCAELRNICNQLVPGIEQTINQFKENPEAFVQSGSTAAIGPAGDGAGDDEHTNAPSVSDEMGRYIGEIALLHAHLAKRNGNIAGIITLEGKDYNASISRNTLSLLNIDISQLIQSPCDVRITNWDPNPANQHFGVEPIIP